MKKLLLFVLCLAVFVAMACDDDPLITEDQRQAGATAIVEPLRDNPVHDVYWWLMCNPDTSIDCPGD
jgi:hypothetical protein